MANRPRQNEIELPPQSAPSAEDLGRQLKVMFDRVASRPMPEHLIGLVDQLEKKHGKGRRSPRTN